MQHSFENALSGVEEFVVSERSVIATSDLGKK